MWSEDFGDGRSAVYGGKCVLKRPSLQTSLMYEDFGGGGDEEVMIGTSDKVLITKTGIPVDAILLVLLRVLPLGLGTGFEIE